MKHPPHPNFNLISIPLIYPLPPGLPILPYPTEDGTPHFHPPPSAHTMSRVVGPYPHPDKRCRSDAGKPAGIPDRIQVTVSADTPVFRTCSAGPGSMNSATARYGQPAPGPGPARARVRHGGGSSLGRCQEAQWPAAAARELSDWCCH
eukprot:763416-Hanusia_phi.AAC.3